jgi:hypothetical protein
VATRCPASGLLGVGVGCAPLIRRQGRMHEVSLDGTDGLGAVTSILEKSRTGRLTSLLDIRTYIQELMLGNLLQRFTQA